MQQAFDELSDCLRAGRAEIAQSVLAGTPGLEAARTYSDLVDSIIRRMLEIACERTGASPDTIPIAIVATGGYGRRELSPHSDVDITFIPHKDGDPLVDRIVKEMFTMVMSVFIDSNKMDVGYAYRLFEDFGALDHQTTCGLLDARHIAGSDRIFLALEHDFWAYLNPAEFIFAKLEERRKQRHKSGDTPRVVEPDIKEGVGGLRDLQAAAWVTQARLGLPAARVRGDRAFDVLERESGISTSERQKLERAKSFMFTVRAFAHVLAGAERDQLVAHRQEEIADKLGSLGRWVVGSSGQSTDGLDSRHRGNDGGGGAPPVELLMREYYGHVADVDRICSDIMRRAENSRLFLGIGLDCVRKEIVPANPALKAEDPVWVLWACELAQKHNLDFDDDLERIIVELMESKPAIGDVAQAGQIVARMFASTRGVYPILQRMADLGILGWMIPEIGRALDLIPYDPSHDYTVGQHSLYLAKHLDALWEKSSDEDPGELRRIMAEIPHPEQLYMAALLHDAGKGDERPHSEVGEELAAAVCGRLMWSEQACDNVRFLVRQHLLMAETSRLRDLNLEETIRDFTAVVNDVDRLHMLYLLTYADTKSVGAGLWTQVKGRFMLDLLHKAERVLTAAEEIADDAGLTRTRRRLMKELAVENLPPEDVAEHVERMPATYIMNTSLSEIALHVGMVRKARQGEPVVDFYDDRDSTFTEVTICSLDDPKPGLLSKIAGVLYATDLEVHSAQVFTRVAQDERIAIDSLYVDFKGRRLTPGKRNELATGLTAVLTGQTTVADLLTKRRKPPEIGGPVDRITLRNDLSESFTVVEVASQDERAMLYRASGALSALGWDIHSARLSQFKGRSVASFYVTGPRAMGEEAARTALLALMPV